LIVTVPRGQVLRCHYFPEEYALLVFRVKKGQILLQDALLVFAVVFFFSSLLLDSGLKQQIAMILGCLPAKK
jgi:hypothetical protein